MKNHSLFISLRNLTGNARGCVLTEPLWGIPFNLYAPYVSIYMVSLGISDAQIGTIVSISWSLQIFAALLGGMITDKLGRRLTTLLFDLISWAVPAFIWAISQNFWYFLAAGIVNSLWRIVHTSWTCLLVEDTDPAEIVDIYSWIYIAGLLVAFFAPLAGFLIQKFTLVPTMRGLYFFAAFMFTLKCILTYLTTRETQQGLVRMHETRHQSVFTIFAEYRGVLRDFLHSPPTLYTAGIMIIMSICLMINGSFWGIIVTEKIRIPAQNLAVFPFIKSIVMMLFFFFIVPLYRRLHFKIPMTVGFGCFVLSQLLLVTAPEGGYLWVGLSIFLEAGCIATINPLLDQLAVLTVEAKERARIMGLLFLSIILFTSPFGWIAGTLSSIDKSLPFLLNIVLFAAGGLLAYQAGRASQKRLAEELAS